MKFRFIRKTHTGYFEQHIYQNNGNLAVAIVSWETDGGYWTPFGTLSVNTDLRLPINQFVAKTWDGQDELLAQFVKDGYFTDTGRRTICGRVENVPIYQITEKFLAEVGKAPEGTVHMTIDRYAEVNANEFFKHAANKAWCDEHHRARSPQHHIYFMDGQYDELFETMKECSDDFVKAYKKACAQNVEFVMFHCDV